MHSALIIDEVLETILEHCSDWSGAEYRWTLCQLARCCKAWKDPALARLWKRLDGTEPLIRLVDQSEAKVCTITSRQCISMLILHQDLRREGLTGLPIPRICVQSKARRIHITSSLSEPSHSPRSLS